MTDNQSPELFGQTPSQTVGPFFHYALPWPGGADLAGSSEMGARRELMPPEHDLLNRPAPRAPTDGQVITITGRVLNGAGQPVPDAMIEIWQADAAGDYDSAFLGFGRCATDEAGVYAFRTIRPGPTAGPGNTLQAPHIAIGVLGRGLLKRLVTRLYFADAPENADDPILALTPPERRQTLIAARDADGVWRLDLVLQGPGETVFFDF